MLISSDHTYVRVAASAVQEISDVGAPPIDTSDDEDGGGDNWEWRPDSRALQELRNWVKQNFKLITRPIHDAISQVEPQIAVYPITVNSMGMGSSDIWGSATIHAEWLLESVDALLMGLKSLLLRTDLLARLQVPYERGFDLLSDPYFIDNFIRAVQSSLNVDRTAAFWLFESKEELLPRAKTEIEKLLAKSGGQYTRFAPGIRSERKPPYEVSQIEVKDIEKPTLGLSSGYSAPYHLTDATQGPLRMYSGEPQLKVAAMMNCTYSAEVVVPGYTQSKLVQGILHIFHDLLEFGWEEAYGELDARDYHKRPVKYVFKMPPEDWEERAQELAEKYNTTPEQVTETAGSIPSKILQMVQEEEETTVEVQTGRDSWRDVEIPVYLQLLEARVDQGQLVMVISVDATEG